MPTIYDNITTDLIDGLQEALRSSKRGDFCVGYFNLRGWNCISTEIDQVPAEENSPACRLIVGMQRNANNVVRAHYSGTAPEITQAVAHRQKQKFARSLMDQLTYGSPTNKDQAGLARLKKQLRSGHLQVKFFGRYPLHAKLYLVHRTDTISPIIGYVGSSNLTFSGMEKQGELNVDVVEKDAAEKLAAWFEERWNDTWCLDITEELADIIENSWAGGPIKPYEIYIKTAYELSREAIQGTRGFTMPRDFENIMLDFQKQAVFLAAERLCHPHGGVIVGDVVGLGKTLVASAIAKIFQEDQGDNVLVICPANLQEMWKGYFHRYNIAGDVLSLGKVRRLPKMRRFRLVIIDESHNLRNREAQRHSFVRDYIRENDSRVVLLTATPFNKQFTDIGSQLRLFLDADADLGIRPDEYIHSLGGASHFGKKHPNSPVTSLAAFEHSEQPDDWRELMRMFMVRRTREHIKKNYAEYDEDKKQHYLRFTGSDIPHYFPNRIPKCAKFSMGKEDPKDQYALLYSESVVDKISKLKLPRYGIGEYLSPEYSETPPPADLTEEEKRIIKNLNRAGTRLIGFAKSGLFKRLESSGPAFLLSIKRHIIRNAVYISALEEENGEFPLGNVFSSLTDESLDEDEINDMFSTEGNNSRDEIEYFLDAGRNIYRQLVAPEGNFRNKFQWIRASLFTPSLRKNIMADCSSLLEVLKKVPEWDADADRKIEALAKLCQETHAQEKLLVFTQFKDTADYLYRELKKRGVDRIAEVFGTINNISEFVKRFSPGSNDEDVGQLNELRVLITTDTLSEGQNLQDAHVVVNFDLPWAIIRLIQRAGRVDRIGQRAREIFCYCFLPEDGINDIIELRDRLNRLLKENAEVVGTDEVFFEGDKMDLSQVYEEKIVLEEQEDETDLISRAYDIWRQAIKDDKKFQKKIETMPNVVYSSKRAKDDASGALAYVKTSTNQHILAQIDEGAEVVTQSQSKVLTLLECEPNEPVVEAAENHHNLVSKAVSHAKEKRPGLGGQLGSPSNIRHRVYNRLEQYLNQPEKTLFHTSDLKSAVEEVYNYPLKETARNKLVRQLRVGISDEELVNMVIRMWGSSDLCAIPKTDEPDKPAEPHIICSMGLVRDTRKNK